MHNLAYRVASTVAVDDIVKKFSYKVKDINDTR